MTPERWAQIEELFHRAAESDPQQRTSLLDEACNGDLELRHQVEALLSVQASTSGYMREAVLSGVDAAMFPLVGDTISHYHILKGLGGGGMGLVYMAEDIKLGRQVALKFLPEESAKNPAALKRFEREARSASALEHPNICPIYEFGEHGGQPFLVMQLLEGHTLRELISVAAAGKPPFAVEKLLDLAIQITAGLEAAHRRGIIHRDIKPANIFVTTQGQAKILDFGLAKLSRRGFEEEDSERDGDDVAATKRAFEPGPLATPDPLLSRTGVAMGTAGYMSPEQARGEKLDTRTDLFSFGLVLYEMATGQRAFKGDTVPVLHDAILTHVPAPVRRMNAGLPAKLEAILHQALEKDRLMRYQAAEELRADLQALARKQESKRSLRRWVPASAAVLALLIAGAIFLSVRRPQPQVLAQIKLRQLTTNSWENSVKSGTISPDGKYLAYLDTQGMHVKYIEGGLTQALVPPEALKKANVQWECCSWFPDSKRFLANAHPGGEDQSAWASTTTSVWEFSRLGEEPRKLLDKAVAWSVSPDNSQIFLGTNRGKLGEREVWLAGPNGERAHKLYEAQEKNAICCLGFLPGERRVSYISTDESGDSVMARDFPSGPVTTLVPASENKKIGDIAWLSGGRLLYSDLCSAILADEACNFWIMRFDTRSWKVIEKPQRLTDWHGSSLFNPSVTADGKRVAFLRSSAGYETTYMADLEAGWSRIRNLKHFTLEESDDFVGGWTPDSRAVFIFKNRGDHYGVVKRDLNSETEEVIVPAASGGFAGLARVSPDGKWILIRIFPLHEGSFAPHPLVRVSTAGGSPELITTVPHWSGIFCAKAPSNLCVLAEPTKNEKQMVVLAFDPIKGRGPELMRYDIDPLPGQDGLLPIDISPDGTRLAVAKHTEGPIEILSLNGELQQVIHAKELNNIGPLGWTSDGKGLFVSNLNINGGVEVLHVGLHDGVKVFWTFNEGGDSRSCYWSESPDGRHIALNGMRQNTTNIWMMENF